MSRKYFEDQATISRRARELRDWLNNKAGCALFESAPGIEQIKSVWQSAYHGFKDTNGEPSNQLLANAYGAFQRHQLLEASSEASSSGVGKVAVWSILILPVMLTTATRSMVTFVNAEHDVINILDIALKANSAHGDHKSGDLLQGTQSGKFSGMRRFVTSADLPDDKKATFTFDAKNPIRPGTIRLVADGNDYLVDFENAIDRESSIMMTGLLAAKVTVNYSVGTVSFTFDVTPAKGTNLLVECDLDEEADKHLIPEVIASEHMDKLRCTRYFLSSYFTIQAMMDAQKEQGLDMTNFLIGEMTRFIAQEQDFRRLRTALARVINKGTIDATMAAGSDYEEWAMMLKRHVLEESDKLQVKNKAVGITGAICGEKAGQVFRSLRPDYFDPDPSFQLSNGIRRAGRLFGLIELYCLDAESTNRMKKEFPDFDTDQVLFYGSDGAGHSPLIAGDGIAPTLIRHHPFPHLQNRAALYGTEINAVNPFHGCDCMVLVKLDKI